MGTINLIDSGHKNCEFLTCKY